MNKKKMGILGVVVLLVVGGIYFFTVFSNKALEITAIEVEKTSIVRTVEMSGSIYANDSQEINLPMGIKVKEVYFGKDDLVKVGDILAVLDTKDLNLKLNKAQIRLNKLDKDIRNPASKVSGTDDKILLNNIEKANQQYKNVEIDLGLANEKLEDFKVLFENGAISEWELKNQSALVSDLEINFKSAELNIQDAKLRYSDYLNQVSDTKSSLSKDRETSLLDIEEIKNDIANNVIKSEISGVITNFELKKDRETTSNEFIRIQDPNSFKFKAMVPQEDSTLIEKDQKAYIEINGVAGTYEGVVSSKSKTAIVDQSSGSSTPKVEIIIDILNEDSSLVSGFDADALIETATVEGIIGLKNEAIKKDEEGIYFVYLVDANNKAKKIELEVGLNDGYKSQIISGLEVGDKVVSNPPIELTDGLSLKIK